MQANAGEESTCQNMCWSSGTQSKKRRHLQSTQLIQSATNMFVSCELASCRLEAQTSFLPSGLNIGKPSNVDAVVTCSSPDPSGLIRNRSKLPNFGSV